MSLPVTGWGERLRTSGFLVLRMSWRIVSVAIVVDVDVDQVYKKVDWSIERFRQRKVVESDGAQICVASGNGWEVRLGLMCETCHIISVIWPEQGTPGLCLLHYDSIGE
jgi:hypothetical protein